MKKILCLVVVFIIALTSISFARATHVRSSVTKSGTYRKAHYRTSPNKTKKDNWSTKGNINLYTGKKGTKNSY